MIFGRLRSVFAEDADHTALDFDVPGRNDDGVHLAIGRLEADLAARFAVEALERGVGAANEGDDDFTGIGDLGLLDDDVIAVQDVVLNHGVALHLKHIAIAAIGEIAEREGFAVLDGFHGTAGSDAPGQRKLDGLAVSHLLADRLGQLVNFDRAALVIAAADEAFFSRVLMCLWTVASECSRIERAISSKLGE